MVALSIAVDVNPPGAAPRLTRAQVWQGLVMKAEDARPFVPGMAECRVLERLPDGLLREVEYEGRRLRERITFTPPVQVLFERVGTAEEAGWITNLLSDRGDDLVLTFTFAVRFPGTAPGSAEEQAAAARMRGAYVAAVEATLRRVRALAAEGRL